MKQKLLLTTILSGLVWGALSAPSFAQYPIAPTAPQYDSSQNIANTQWVNRFVYSVGYPSGHDDTAAFTTALAACGTSHGGIISVPAGTFLVHGLSRPAGCTIAGSGQFATTLKLLANTNTYIIADQSYVNNTTSGTVGGGLYNLTLDGNNTQNNGSFTSPLGLYILRGAENQIRWTIFQNSQDKGLLFTELSANGTDKTGGGMSGNYVTYSQFINNNGAGIYAQNGPSNNVADMRVLSNIFNSNSQASSATDCQMTLERSSGFTIQGNFTFGDPVCELSALLAGNMRLSDNYMDGSKNQATSGNICTASVTMNGGGAITINGNTWKNIATSLGGASGITALCITQQVSGSGIALNGNSFQSTTLSETAFSYLGANRLVSALWLGGNVFSPNTPTPLWTVAAGSAQVPNCTAGTTNLSYPVNDLSSPVMGSSASGSGAVAGEVRCNGSAWTVNGL